MGARDIQEPAVVEALESRNPRWLQDLMEMFPGGNSAAMGYINFALGGLVSQSTRVWWLGVDLSKQALTTADVTNVSRAIEVKIREVIRND